MRPTGKVEDLMYNVGVHFQLMQNYADFFSAVFKAKLISFGYEKIYYNGLYEGLSNLPEIAELFIETKAYTGLKSMVENFFGVNYGLIHLNTLNGHTSYSAFRRALNERLKIHTSFYMVESCSHYYNVFIWNFHAPPPGILHQEQDVSILMSFMNNLSGIKYVIENFKSLYRQKLSKEIIPIKTFDPPLKQSQHTFMEEKLIELNHLTESDLELKNLSLSEKEAICIHLYLQGSTNKEIAAKMFLSIRTIEDYLKRIRETLNVKLRSEVYAAIKKLALWKKLL